MFGYKIDGSLCECLEPCRACVHARVSKARGLANGFKEVHLEVFKDVIRRLRARMPVSPFAEPAELPELVKLHDALQRFKGVEADFTSVRYLRLHERANWNGTDPRMMWFAGTLIRKLRERGFPFYVHTAYRSPALQRQLKQAGHSQVRSGPHQRGAAVDVVHGFFHWNLDENMWLYVGLLGEHIARQNSLPIEWGGRWKFYDPAHWQLKDWRSMPTISDFTEVKMTPTAALQRGSPVPPRKGDVS